MDENFYAMVEKWKKKACRYWTLAETEENPVGKKFYQASAQTLANCVFDLEKVFNVKLTKEINEAGIAKFFDMRLLDS